MIKIMLWGNSLALRLPKNLTETLHLKEGSLVNIRTEKNRIIVEPADEATLDEMLSLITPENLHEEIKTGDAKGKEVW
ncbi:MAG TPA: AbrB/MazE/SpoVT family DNA-binding domain-containing protein [bacterium]|nr:AbrB/MazE/SpoVT family DNA-binding domain-containing protein [bacterium]